MTWRATSSNRELKQPRRRRQQKPHKFAYLTMKDIIFPRFARAVFIFWHFVDVLVLSTTWNDLFCSCVDDANIWWQLFNFVLLCPKRWLQFNCTTVRTHFSSIMTLNNWKMIAEIRSYIFGWRSRFRGRRVCCSLIAEIMPFANKHWNFAWFPIVLCRLATARIVRRRKLEQQHFHGHLTNKGRPV